jgi:hypothetical protein
MDLMRLWGEEEEEGEKEGLGLEQVHKWVGELRFHHRKQR